MVLDLLTDIQLYKRLNYIISVEFCYRIRHFTDYDTVKGVLQRYSHFRRVNTEEQYFASSLCFSLC